MFLFFIQLVGDLIESIYMLDLLNLELDEKVLGLLFLLTPFILLVFRHKVPNYFLEAVIGTTEVHIRVGTTIFNVYGNHPALWTKIQF